MSKTAIKWLARCFRFAAIGVAIWWSGIGTVNADWKTYGVLCLVGMLDLIGGFMDGYRKCAISHDIEGDL